MQEIQKRLHLLQRSEQGYEIGQKLLELDTTNCRFFGALTLAVVINNTRDLFDDQAAQLVRFIEHHVVALYTTSTANGVVVTKLLSNLLLLFIKNPQAYHDPLLSLAAAFGDLAPLPPRVALLLGFSATIVEELSRKQNLPPSIHRIVQESVFPATIALLEVVGQNRPELDEPSLRCCNSWITYIVVAEDSSDVRYTPETSIAITEYILSFFQPTATFSNENLNFTSLNQAISVMAEIFDLNPRILSPASRDRFKRILFDWNQWGANMIADISSGSAADYPDDVSTFTNLVVSFLLVDILQLARSILLPETRATLELLMKLTEASGIPADEDQVSGQMLTFWEDLATVFTDDSETFEALFKLDMNPLPKDVFVTNRNDLFNAVCLIYWQKILVPSNEHIADFHSYRSNVADFFIAVYSLITLPFFEQLVVDVVNSLQSNTDNVTVSLEATIFLIYKIVDDVSFYENQCNALIPSINSIYSAGLLGVLDGLDRRLKPTFVRFLSSTQFYLKTPQGVPYLGPILEFLFLIIFSSDSTLSLVASKTVVALCQECRENLIEFLPILGQILAELLNSERMDNVIRQRLFNAYVSVAQTLKDPAAIADTLYNVLSAIHDRVSRYFMANQNLDGEQEDYVISLLSSVYEVGRACQLPDDLDVLYTSEQSTQVNSFWEADPRAIKPLILLIVEDFSSRFPNSTLVAEKCCLVLRCGIGEPINGPFFFPFDLILQYLTVSMNRQIANVVPNVLGLFEKYIVANSKQFTRTTLELVLQQTFVPNIDFIKSEPDMVLSSIQLFATILEKAPSLLVSLDLFKTSVTPLALAALKAQETFILKASSKFWIHLLTLRKAGKEDQDTVRAFLTTTDAGPSFTRNLLSSFVNSPRSHLEFYYPIFRNLIGKYPIECKQWMAQENVDQTVISKLMLSRGQRSANDILKKFWMDHNGLTDYHTQPL